MSADYILLLRRAPAGPGPVPASLLWDGPEAPGAPLLFLHGEGVRWAAVGTEATIGQLARFGPRAFVCRTSWRRRFGDDPVPLPFRQATLATLLGDVEGSERIDSVTPASALCSARPMAGPMLLELDRPPGDDRDALETLEIVLAAAALELPATVLVTQRGRGHLDGESGRRWRQVTDLGLMPVLVEGCASKGHAVTGSDAVAARRRAGRIVLL